MDIITQAHRFFIRHALIQPIQKEIDDHARIDMFDEFGLALRQSLCLLIGQDQCKYERNQAYNLLDDLKAAYFYENEAEIFHELRRINGAPAPKPEGRLCRPYVVFRKRS